MTSMWTVTVPPSYPYGKLVEDAGYANPKGIVKNDTMLGTGVGVEDADTGDGFLVFDGKDGTYIVYYWRNA